MYFCGQQLSRGLSKNITGSLIVLQHPVSGLQGGRILLHCEADVKLDAQGSSLSVAVAELPENLNGLLCLLERLLMSLQAVVNLGQCAESRCFTEFAREALELGQRLLRHSQSLLGPPAEQMRLRELAHAGSLAQLAPRLLAQCHGFLCRLQRLLSCVRPGRHAGAVCPADRSQGGRLALAVGGTLELGPGVGGCPDRLLEVVLCQGRIDGRNELRGIGGYLLEVLHHDA
mmetsp:Transcript_82472/g.233660  ORF Transcript_82472/g.233660 Transcript_82472/m.233660 type:complete len:230 (+) Transcript_82472:1208-1897(+)